MIFTVNSITIKTRFLICIKVEFIELVVRNVRSFISERLKGVSLLGRKSIKRTKYKETEKSTLAEHQNNTNHNIDWDNGKVIKTSKNVFIRKLDEAIAIRSSDENLFMPYIWNKFILKR